MCMCLARGGVGGVGVEWIRFGLNQSWTNMGEVGYVSVFGYVGVGGVCGEWVGGLGLGGWGCRYVCRASFLRRAIALARHRVPNCCVRRVIFSAPRS